MPKVAKVCQVCKKSFEVWPNRASTARTCSLECTGKLNAARYEAERETRPCLICGKVFSFPKCHSERRRACSKACALKAEMLRHHGRGDECHNWKGGTAEHSDGYLYRYVPDHPFAKSFKYILDHRSVMEEWMRDEVPGHHFLVKIAGTEYLRPDIEVHHRNENKRDNLRTNLLACTQPAHRAIHNGKPPMEGEVWPPIEGMVPFTPFKVSRICETCGTQFIATRTLVAKGFARFCCRVCYNARPREAFHVVPL